MNYLSKFRKDHCIDSKANLSDIKVSVESVFEANKIAWDFIANIDNKTEKDGFITHTHLNLIGRIFEQVEGMLTCIVNKCPTSSEALGRNVIEGSVNLMYIACLGNEKTIAAFFSSWLTEHTRKLSEWKEKIQCKEYSEKVGSMINARLSAMEGYKWYVDLIVNNFSLDISDFSQAWPKSIYKRFEALDMEESYYENYHRLSGSSHLTAEDTIAWLIALQVSDEQKHRLAEEAWAYSIMMSRLSCVFFVNAVAACCITHGMEDEENIKKLKAIRKNLHISAMEISKAAGVPE
ncbi:MAG: DUF5677 domain-containing protein [Pseudomonadota bacterium]